MVKRQNQQAMELDRDNKSILLFAFGNTSRGDDALAPLLLQQIKDLNLKQAYGYPLKYLEDYQLQVEHVMDMQDCERVILIDASQSIQRSYDFSPIQEQFESSYTTHGMSPANLLHTYRQVHQHKAPVTAMLAIQGVSFELGQPLSSVAEINLQQAFRFLRNLLMADDFSQWELNVPNVLVLR